MRVTVPTQETFKVSKPSKIDGKLKKVSRDCSSESTVDTELVPLADHGIAISRHGFAIRASASAAEYDLPVDSNSERKPSLAVTGAGNLNAIVSPERPQFTIPGILKPSKSRLAKSNTDPQAVLAGVGPTTHSQAAPLPIEPEVVGILEIYMTILEVDGVTCGVHLTGQTAAIRDWLMGEATVSYCLGYV
jgi:hypothetical protein